MMRLAPLLQIIFVMSLYLTAMLRKVKLPEGNVHEQTLTLPKTPSDFRSTLNALALIRRLDERVSSGSVLFLCKYCGENLEESDFSRNQLKKPSGNRRCKNCT